MEELIATALCFTMGGGFVLLVLLRRCLFILEPNQAAILLYWGKYKSTLQSPGFNFAQPIGLRRIDVSTRDHIINLPITTVVEASGNPVQVSAVCIYRVTDPRKATLDIQDLHQFVQNQASAVLKAICSRYPYESDDVRQPSLKAESPELIQALSAELQKQVAIAGVGVVLIRLNDLTYAPEIMQAMLLRQQAEAMVDARRTVVEGAVMTVREAIDQLERSGIQLSPANQTSLVSNLTLLLCAGDRGESHSTVVSRGERR
jgi:regulator of protease activity HflC (stomatin/prohibitin superfamily)